jgi:hypothetical protein
VDFYQQRRHHLLPIAGAGHATFTATFVMCQIAPGVVAQTDLPFSAATGHVGELR